MILDYGQTVCGGESEQDATNTAIVHAGIGVGASTIGGIAAGAAMAAGWAPILVTGVSIVVTVVTAQLLESVYDNVYDSIKNLQWKDK